MDIQCAPATHDALIALGCAERPCVFEGADDASYPRFFRNQPVFMDQA